MDETGGLSAPLGRTWWVRLRAVLATGLVLGVGATTTLAAWTEQVTVQGDFAASTFALETNPSTPFDGAESAWAAADESAVLQLEATDLTPGSTRHASLALRAGARSLGGSAVLGGAVLSAPADPARDLGGALRYRAVLSQACGPEAFGPGAVFLVGSTDNQAPLTRGQDAASPFELPAATDAAPGRPVHLCFEVSLPADAPDELQGQEATARWSLNATSETT